MHENENINKIIYIRSKLFQIGNSKFYFKVIFYNNYNKYYISIEKLFGINSKIILIQFDAIQTSKLSLNEKKIHIFIVVLKLNEFQVSTIFNRRICSKFSTRIFFSENGCVVTYSSICYIIFIEKRKIEFCLPATIKMSKTADSLA